MRLEKTHVRDLLVLRANMGFLDKSLLILATVFLALLIVTGICIAAQPLDKCTLCDTWQPYLRIYIYDLVDY
jgi:cytochrome b subunit of formate dehydrogenase